MTDSGRHPTLDLVSDLYWEVVKCYRDAHDEAHGSAIPGRTVDAPVSGGGRSDPTSGRAIYGTAPSTDEHPDPPKDPDEFGAVGSNPALSLVGQSLTDALKKVKQARRTLRPDNPPPERVCVVCGCAPERCRAVHPQRNPKLCDSCYQHRRRYGRDRTHDEVAKHQQRMHEREMREAREAAQRHRAH